MGSRYTSQSTTGYNSSPPSDDGSTTAANKVTWATIKTKLADVLKTFGEAINTALVTALDVSVGTTSTNYTTLPADHQKPILCTNSITISLCDAATAAVGYQVTVVNVGTGIVTVGVITAANTLNGTANGTMKLGPKQSVTFETNNTPDGYVEISSSAQWKLLSVGTASTSAALDFTGLTGYVSYLFVLELVLPATNNVALVMRISDDNGATYKAGATDYAYAGMGSTSAPASAAFGSTGVSFIAIAGAVGNTATGGVNGTVTLTGAASTTKTKPINWTDGYIDQAAGFQHGDGSGYYGASTVAINAVRFLMSSGNIASGVIRCYGLRG